MTDTDATVLLGHLVAGFPPGDIIRDAWREAFTALDAGIAGEAVRRLIAAARPGHVPSIAEFHDLYIAAGGTVPRHVLAPATGRVRRPRRRPASPPPTTVPDPDCDSCDRTGWVPDHTDSGWRPCTCPVGARVAPVHARIVTAPTRPAETVVPPPWITLGITADEWRTRQVPA